MRKLKYISVLTLTLAIVLCIYQTSANKRSDISEGNSSRIENKTEIEAILEQIDTLTRDNEQLRTENEALKAEIREFSWLKEAGK